MKAFDEVRTSALFTHRMSIGPLLALILLIPAGTFAGGVVTNCTEANLRAAMSGGGLVTFTCDGTITLSATIANSTDTFLDGSGHQVTISGGDAVRVFYVTSNVTFIVNHITITHGRSETGAGILNYYGRVNATNTTFSGNLAFGGTGPSGAGESVRGGAVDNSGTLNLANCSFIGNGATGGTAGSYPYGNSGGAGYGGAIWNSGILTAVCCTLASNSATGGPGGQGAPGPPFPWTPGGPGGPGGDGSGGALYNSGFACLVNCTLALNPGKGGGGGPGGPSYPYPGYPPGPPGPPGATGLGVGAIHDASGQCYLTNCTVAFNSGTGASSASGFSSCGGISSFGATLVNTLLAENAPGGNGCGVLTDLGHNLSSDSTCSFTNAGSLNNTYAALGSLTNNGGPTATIAPLRGSRVIDAADTAAAPPTDQRGVARPFGPAADIGAYEYDANEGGPIEVVTECTEAALRVAMAGGGTVTFACDGTLLLSSTISVTTNTVIDAVGRHICITALAGVPAFRVEPGATVTFALANLVISNCAGIVNSPGASFKASNSVFCVNRVALHNAGDAQLSTCIFQGNRLDASAGDQSGGAVMNYGSLLADLCVFAGNSVMASSGTSGSWYGESGTSGASAAGGAICNFGTVNILRSTFTNNSAIGGQGGHGYPGHHGDPGMSGGPGGSGGLGGRGEGGAIYNAGTAQVANTVFAYNAGRGGNGGNGADGGPAYGGPGGGGDAGGGAAGGNGVGAVFNSGTLQLINSTFASNSGLGGSGGTGANGGSGSTVGGDGGNGGNGGSGFGAINDQSTCAITNVTFGSNSGFGGTGGGAGSPGTGFLPGTPGVPGSAGPAAGAIRTSSARLINTLLGVNIPGGNCAGTVIDLGHNLSSDSTCAFTNVGSVNNTPALLGPLANNGGPTLTLALLFGSPAIDAGVTIPSLYADQRGFPRPAGAAADIGAYESGSVMPTLSIARAGGLNLNIVGYGNTGQVCRLLVSTNLLHWVSLATNSIGSNGTALFNDTCGIGACRYYQLVMP